MEVRYRADSVLHERTRWTIHVFEEIPKEDSTARY